jgi:hypothetical protein
MYSQKVCGYVGSDMKLDTGSRQVALEYAEKGWAVLPLLPNKKDPHFDLAQGAYLSATTDSKLINFWFDYDQNINIGIACFQSGLVVLDIDYRNGGQMLPEFKPTYTVETGDGLHLYYKADQSNVFRGKLTDGIDIKWKGYVATAPSIHPSGARYTVIDDRDPVAMPLTIWEWATK